MEEPSKQTQTMPASDKINPCISEERPLFSAGYNSVW
jgi:hypothetical protein